MGTCIFEIAGAGRAGPGGFAQAWVGAALEGVK